MKIENIYKIITYRKERLYKGFHPFLKQWRFITVVLATVMSSPVILASSQVLKLDSNIRLKATIAKDAMNRIGIHQDRITQVFGDEDLYVLQTDEHTGQIFIKPSEINDTRPLSITLITENGHTQDLTLEPAERNAATIILKPSIKELASISEVNKTDMALRPTLEKAVPIQEQLLSAMKQLISENPPTLEEETKQDRTIAGFDVIFKSAHQVGVLKGLIYDIKNTTDTTIEMQERSFYQGGDLAISFKKRVLEPGQSTTLYVVSRLNV